MLLFLQLLILFSRFLPSVIVHLLHTHSLPRTVHATLSHSCALFSGLYTQIHGSVPPPSHLLSLLSFLQLTFPSWVAGVAGSVGTAYSFHLFSLSSLLAWCWS